jgi:CrcB protein
LPRLLLVVALGGVLGALARGGLLGAADHLGVSGILTVIAINAVGSGLAGFLVARLADRLSEPVRAFLFAGVLGGFTTFSAVSVDFVGLVHSSAGDPAALARACGVLTVSVVIPLVGAWTGLRLGRPRP